jgi:hypothetical protein
MRKFVIAAAVGFVMLVPATAASASVVNPGTGTALSSVATDRGLGNCGYDSRDGGDHHGVTGTGTGNGGMHGQSCVISDETPGSGDGGGVTASFSS